MSVAIIIAAALLADICAATQAPTPSAAAVDSPVAQENAEAAAESTRYADVGDIERKAGHARTAAIAYRRALELDHANARARAALDELCRADSAPPPDRPASPRPRDPAAEADDALGQAMARYSAGDLSGAAPLFERATRAAETRGAAHFFLGMIAYRRHDVQVAVREFSLAAKDPQYVEAAGEMRRLARREGRLSVSLLTQAEVDSNVELLPDTPLAFSTSGTPASDVNALVLGIVEVRPTPGLLLRESLFWRDQVKLSQFDFLRERFQAGYEFESARHRTALRYDFNFDMLDGSAYLYAHRLGLAYRFLATERVTVGAAIDMRRRDFTGPDRNAFNGFVETGTTEVTFRISNRWDLGVTATGARDGAQDATFASVAGGGALMLRFRATPWLRVAGSARGTYASYDAAQPDGVLRRDLHGEAELDAELDLGDSLLLFVGADAVRNDSTVEDFRYLKLAAHLGLAVTFVLP